MTIELAPADCLSEPWLAGFYPEDLPLDWRFDYYANEFQPLLIPARWWKTEIAEMDALAESLKDQLQGYLEIDTALISSPHWQQMVDWISALDASISVNLIAKDTAALDLLQNSRISALQNQPATLIQPTNWGWQASFDSVATVCFYQPDTTLDLKLLGQIMTGLKADNNTDLRILFIDTTPGGLEQAEILRGLI